MKLSFQCGRADKDGRHNDRNFNIRKSDHIDEERSAENRYWTYNGDHESSFRDVELTFYRDMFTDVIEAQNARNNERRQSSRNKTVEDYYTNRKTRPEDVIIQIGDINEAVDADKLWELGERYVEDFTERYGKNCTLLDMAMHVDEATPHLHIRRTWHCIDENGNEKASEAGALEKLGFKPKGDEQVKSDFPKKNFTEVEREALYGLCKELGIELEEGEPEKRAHLTVDEYKKMKDEERDLAAKEIDIERFRERNREIENEKAELLTSITWGMEELDSLKRNQSEVQKQTDILLMQQKDAEEKKKQLREKLSEMEQKYAELESALEAKRQEIEEKQAKITNEQTRIDEIQGSIETERANAAAEIEKIRGEVEAEKAKAEEIRREMRENAFSDLSSDKDALEEERKNLEAEIEAERSKNNGLAQELKSLKEEAEKLEREKGINLEELKDIRADREDLLDELDKIDAKIVEKGKELKDLSHAAEIKLAKPEKALMSIIANEDIFNHMYDTQLEEIKDLKPLERITALSEILRTELGKVLMTGTLEVMIKTTGKGMEDFFRDKISALEQEHEIVSAFFDENNLDTQYKEFVKKYSEQQQKDEERQKGNKHRASSKYRKDREERESDED